MDHLIHVSDVTTKIEFEVNLLFVFISFFLLGLQSLFPKCPKREPKQSTETGPYPKQPRTFSFFLFLIMTKTVKPQLT